MRIAGPVARQRRDSKKESPRFGAVVLNLALHLNPNLALNRNLALDRMPVREMSL
jgi:hypothetical protein